MSGSEEQIECPLCMEPLEIDDINFFPCTCGYQICRFCWHRLRTDENGLCPACRKAYPEDPAKFNPLTEDELQRIKKERRQKDLQRKQKAAENRKHLANVRVVQRNLVFVVGLSTRLADAEVLRKHEYFGKFGKIHKVVINQSTSYAGAQGPSASAYVTYNKPEDALKAIIAVNNVHIDGRTLKASLGTTKYCSHFLRGTQCPKTDCMYLHELGEEAASFTKEEMQVGKHQEYEQRLSDQYMNSQNTAQSHANNKIANRKKTSSPTQVIQTQPSGGGVSPAQSHSPPASNPVSNTPQQVPPNTANKEAWPSLQSGNSTSGSSNTNTGSANTTATSSSTTASSSTTSSAGVASSTVNGSVNSAPASKPAITNTQGLAVSPPNSSSTVNSIEKHKTDSANSNKAPGKNRPMPDSPNTDMQNRTPLTNHITSGVTDPPPGLSLSNHVNTQLPNSTASVSPPRLANQQQNIMNSLAKRKALGLDATDNLSLFSSINGFHGVRNPKPPVTQPEIPDAATTEIPDTLPVSTTTDWQAAFGFGQSSTTSSNKNKDFDDDLGFDPLEESSRGLADLLEKESEQKQHHQQQHHHNSLGGFNSHLPFQGLSHHRQMHNSVGHSLPPGFSLSHIPQAHAHVPSSKSLSASQAQPEVLSSRMMGLMTPQLNSAPYPDMFSDLLGGSSGAPSSPSTQQPRTQSQGDALNVKDWQDGLRALLPNINISFGAPQNDLRTNTHINPTQKSNGNWSGNAPGSDSSSWMTCDPAILTSGSLPDAGNSLHEGHWLKSLNQLSDMETTGNHRLPFVQQLPVRNTVWPPQTHNPPPGFQTHIRPPLQTADPHKLAEGLQ